MWHSVILPLAVRSVSSVALYPMLQVQAVNSSYFLGFTIGACLWGALSDRVGRRMCLLATVAASLLSGAATAIAPDYWWFCVTRVLTGARRCFPPQA